MPSKKKTPRGDATPVKKFKGEYMPVPYGPTQKASVKRVKIASTLPNDSSATYS